MPNSTKYPADDGFLDADDAFFAVAPNSWVNLENCRTGSTDAGVVGTVESIGSNVLISTPQPSVSFITIGSEADNVNARVLKFQFNTTGLNHKIIAVYVETNLEYDVLLSSQVTGGLKFSKEHPIHSVRVVNGLLYWTDNLNDQRKINIDAGIKLNNPLFVTDFAAYTSPIDPTVITVLRKPPANPLAITKVTQSSPVLNNNFIENSAFQFSYRYYYRDGEKSVPGVYSLLAPYNDKDDTFNRIDVVVPQVEYIQQDVQSVDILVKYGNENTFFLIKSWNRDIASEAVEIIEHNNGITALSYAFYNDTIGEAQDEAYSLKPFDSVPILSETLEIFDNRLGFGNNLEGYDTPTTTSLDGTVLNETEGATPTGRWVIIRYGGGATHYFIDLGSLGFFDSAVQPTPFPATVAYGTLTLVAAGPATFAQYIVANYTPPWTNGIEYTGNTSTITGAPSPTTLIGARCYKSGAFYKLSTTFYDFGDRKSGITGSALISGVATGQATYQIPDRAYDTVTYVTAINWTLSNAAATTEIPIWATHYSVNVTKCLKTRFFLQARTLNPLSSMIYVDRDDDNAYTFTTGAYTALLTGVGVDITNLQNFGMGYVFSDGDVINIYISGDATVYKLKILDQSGRWLVCELQDLGALSATTDALFEIYTPYIQSINEPYFEVAQMYPVTYPGTSSRIYSNLAGSIRGDVTLLDRGVAPSNYLTENMSPNDKYYLNWWTDGGRPNFIDRIGQQRKLTNISYSNVLIPGTRTNGLSSFDALDEKNIPNQCGAIMKLQITSKVQDELGLVMLAVCVLETASLYIGEVQLYGSNAPSTLAQAPNVIGTVNILKGSYGTLNPESVVEYRGLVWFIDRTNGKVIQYSVNGLDVISDYKMVRFWNLWCKQFNALLAINKYLVTNVTWVFGGFTYTFSWSAISGGVNDIHIIYRSGGVWIDVAIGNATTGAIIPGGVGSAFEVYFQSYIDDELVATTAVILVTTGQSNATPVLVKVPTIEDFGGRPYVFTAVDSVHKELLISIPKLSNTPPKGYLPDYPSTIYPFDILDFQGKAIVYKLEQTGRPPHWQGSMGFYAENFCTIQNKLYSFHNGLTYLHNQTTSYNNFYGTQYKSKIMCVANDLPQVPKSFDNIAVEANMIPSFTYFFNEFPIQQSSDLEDIDYRNLEGVYYATIYRNKLQPTATGYTTDGLLTGEKMRNVAMLIMLEFSATTIPLEMKFLNIGFNISKGHNNQLNNK